MKLFSLLLASLLSAVPALAQPQKSDEPFFNAQAFVIRSAGPGGKEFRDTWNKEGAPQVDNVKDPKRGDPLYIAVFFTYATPDRAGNAKITFTLTMKKPDGTTIGPFPFTAADGKMPDEVRKSVYLSNQMVGLPITDKDPAGKYTFTVKVTDAYHTGDGVRNIDPIVVDIK